MNLNYVWQARKLLLTRLILMTCGIGLFGILQAAEVATDPVVRRPVTSLRAPAVAPKPKVEQERVDYFVSADTVIIGCTSGMAAGMLVGSVPVAGAVMSGIGIPESVSLLINLTGMGCGVGAVSSAVAIFTAWMLDSR